MTTHSQANSPFGRIVGIWEGILTRIDEAGNILETNTSRIIQRFEGDNGWYQQNTFTSPDGKVIQFEFNGSFDANGRLVFDTGNLHGVAIPVTGDVIMLDAATRTPAGRMWEMSNHSVPGERHRVSHRISDDGKTVSIQFFNERRVSDA